SELCVPLGTSNKSRALIFRESSLRLSRRSYFRKLPARGYVHAHQLRKWSESKIEQKKKSKVIYIYVYGQAFTKNLVRAGLTGSITLLEVQEDTLLISIRGETARRVGDEEARGGSESSSQWGSQELRVGKC
ncbi:hypothetical protein X777_11621, partial [Ooceraea biroi]